MTQAAKTAPRTVGMRMLGGSVVPRCPLTGLVDVPVEAGPEEVGVVVRLADPDVVATVENVRYEKVDRRVDVEVGGVV